MHKAGPAIVLHLDPAIGRGLAWMHSAAIFAGPRFLVGIECLEQRRQVLHDILDLDLDPMDALSAFEAEPLESIAHRIGPGTFDHKSDRTLHRALRRMAHMPRQEEHVTL